MTYRERMPDGTIRLTGASSGSQGPPGAPGPPGEQGEPGPPGLDGNRWGYTDWWIWAGSENVPVEYEDGLPPRVGDYILSNNGFSPGDVYRVTEVIDATHVDIEYVMNIRGPSGPGAHAIEYNFAAPSTTWVMAHNLGRKVDVSLFDTNGDEIEGDVHQSSDGNTTTITWYYPVAGSALVQ